MIYFDNGASTHPKPPTVVKAIGTWMQKNGANAGRSGHRLSMEAAELIYDTRAEYAKLFGIGKPENVILVPNATYALNTVILGLFERGDHVITTDLEHNSVLRPLWHLQNKGINVRVVSVDFEDDSKTVEKILGAVQKNTKAIICTQCSNICGKLMPIEELGKRKPQNVLLIVDGSQGAGTIPTDLSNQKIDYYCAPSHKGLMGPQGGGILIVNNRSPRPLIFGGTGTESLHLDQPQTLPEHLESGTLPAPICAGMLAAAKYIQQIGIEKIFEHKKVLTKYAYKSMKQISKIELYMEKFQDTCLGVIPFNVVGYHSADVGEFLDQQGICVRSGLHCAPLYHMKMGTENRGMVRVSFGYFNSIREIDMMARSLKKMN